MMHPDNRLASILADLALVETLVPIACPSTFGPDDRYTLLEVIGAGRASLVYRASDKKMVSEGFHAPVAIKIMRGATTPREALATRRVRHPNVVSVYDHGFTEHGDPYFVMEYLEGEPLNELPLPLEPRRAAAIMEQVARAVQAIHTAGLIHCDLKPSNILIDEHDRVKVLDLDLARWRSDQDSRARGNLAFMAPEQYRSEPEALTPPADIYALGGLLHYLLTGEFPHGQSPEDITQWHTKPEPIAASGPRALAAMVTRATALKREDRYFAAASLAEDLHAWLEHRPPPNIKASTAANVALWIKRRPVYAMVAAMGLLGVMAVPVSMAAVATMERDRAEVIERETRERTAREIETFKAQMREPIEKFIRLVTRSIPADQQSTAVPMVMWLNTLLDHPLLGRDGQMMSAEARIPVWTRAIERAESAGQASDAETALLRLALAADMLDTGNSSGAVVEIAVLRKVSAVGLSPSDTIWTIAEIIEDAATAIDPAQTETARMAARDRVATALRYEPSLRDRPALKRTLTASLERPSPK